MDHPHVMPAYFLPMNPGLDTSFYLAHVHPGRQFTGTLTLAPAVLEKHGMASVSFTLEPSLRVGSRGPAEEDERLLNKGLPEPPRSWRELAAELSGFARPLSRVLVDLRMGGAMARARGAKRYSAYRMTYRGEQVPNPNSRVTLTEKKDPLGVPTGQLHWDLEARDLEVVTQAVDVIGQEMGRRGIGRINAEPWRTGGSRKVVGGAHHVGTTRMSNDPRRGVIDRNCKVHDLENLYVSGSSVFTTSGSANPTLTIVALALRLAEHIEKVIT